MIPLTSQNESKIAIAQARDSSKKVSVQRGPVVPGSDSDSSDDELSDGGSDRAEDDDRASLASLESFTKDAVSEARPAGPKRNTSTIAEDVIGKKGQYGRFAERWFSNKGWSTERRRVLGMSSDDSVDPQATIPQGVGGRQAALSESTESENISNPASGPRLGGTQQLEQSGQPKITSPSVAKTLLPKLLRTTRTLLASQSFFFSYDLDITRKLDNRCNTDSEVPLHRLVDTIVSLPQLSRL